MRSTSAASAYTIGGSLASSFSGEPRASIDVDIVVDLASERIDALVAALGSDFYADADSLRRAVRNRSNVNLIHHASGIKVDLFVAGSASRTQTAGAAPSDSAVRRCPRPIRLHARRPGTSCSRSSILVSSRRRRFGWPAAFLSILIVQGDPLDEAYLAQRCGRKRTHRPPRARQREAAGPRPPS